MRDSPALASVLRGAALVLMLCVLVLGVLTAHTVLEGQAELEESKAAFDRGELGDAIQHARRAAGYYAPGAPHVDAAYARLRAIAFGSEANGDTPTARLAWGAMRSAALETRHAFVSRARELDEADRQLSRLARGQSGRGQGASASLAKGERSLSRVAPLAAAPAPGWAALLALGFLLALGGFALIGFAAVEPQGRIRARPALLGALVSVLGAACWTLALFWA
jgi:hypothetical protein